MESFFSDCAGISFVGLTDDKASPADFRQRACAASMMQPVRVHRAYQPRSDGPDLGVMVSPEQVLS
ncbi:MAG: hypothetical protein RIT02_3548 [Planctomycetota bacterium]